MGVDVPTYRGWDFFWEPHAALFVPSWLHCSDVAHEGEAAVARQQTVLVVGLVAEDEAPTTFIPHTAFDDFAHQTVYEVILRLRADKLLPFPLMTTVCTQDELLRLVRAAEQRGVRLCVMTDERLPVQPESVQALLALLPEQTRTDRASKPL